MHNKTLCSSIPNTKILIIGGTQMIGRDFVELCIENNIYPTLANRGVTNTNLFLDLKKIFIDRNDKFKCFNLKNKYFDIVIDFSCYNVNQFLNIYDNIKYNKYIIISTLCVFSDSVLNDESHWLHNYCKNKQLLETYIINTKINNICIVRPCVLYGKNDYTNRFYEKNNSIYWKNSDTIVIPDKYHMPVRKFSLYLLQYILNNINNTFIHIDNDGLQIIQ